MAASDEAEGPTTDSGDSWLLSCDARAKPAHVVSTLQAFVSGKELRVMDLGAELFESQSSFQAAPTHTPHTEPP